MVEFFAIRNGKDIDSAALKTLWGRLTFLSPVNANVQFSNSLSNALEFVEQPEMAIRIVLEIVNLAFEFPDGFDLFAHDKLFARWAVVVGLVDVKSRAVLKNVVEVSGVERALVGEIAFDIAIL